jgi:hypothetical protein
MDSVPQRALTIDAIAGRSIGVQDIVEPAGKLHTLHSQVVKNGVARTMPVLAVIFMGVYGCTTCTTNKNMEYAGETQLS